uniref:Uncharacterized protein n=1 Tax=Romanomermis culicivorax TaxID=13658 RepID=A0A915IKY5_ROMCU
MSSSSGIQQPGKSSSSSSTTESSNTAATTSPGTTTTTSTSGVTTSTSDAPTNEIETSIETSNKEDGESGVTSAFTTEIEIEDDDGDRDIRKVILDEYERCLIRHGTSLADLLRLHQQESVATKKLTLKLQQATKRENKEKRKAEALNKAVDDILKGVNTMVQQPSASTDNKADALKRAVDDIRRQIDDYRRRKENLERQIEQLKAQYTQGQAKLTQKRTSEEELAKLAAQADEAKAEVVKILKDLNQSLALVNRRINTTYSVKEDPESAGEVRNVLDSLLNDVVKIVTEHRKLTESIENLRRKIEENEKHIEHAKQMNEFLTNEAKKLLAIGNRKEAQQIDPTNYEAVRKFVDETFQDVIEKLKAQNKEMGDLADTKAQAEREAQNRKADLDRELAVKQAKIDAARDALNKLNAQNEFLRGQLSREPKSPIASESETEILRNLKNVQETADKSQNAALEAQLQRSRAQNDDARRQLNDLTSAINEADEKLAAKRRELQELNEKAEQDRETNRQQLSDLDKKIVDVLREIECLERELTDLNAKSGESKQLKQELDKLSKLEKELSLKVKQMEDQLRQTENDRNRFGNDLNRNIGEYNALKSKSRLQDMRRDRVEEKLQEVKDRVADVDRKIDRERDRANALERDGAGRSSTAIAPPPMPFLSPKAERASSPSRARKSASRDDLDDQIKNLEDSRNLSKNRRDVLRRKLSEKVDDGKIKSTKMDKSLEKGPAPSVLTGSEQQYDVSGELIVDMENGKSQTAPTSSGNSND